MARRAHATHQGDGALGQVLPPGGGLPQRVRQDESRDARSHHPRLDGRDRRRRHRLAAHRPGWAPARHQSRGGLLRCRSRYRPRDQSHGHRHPVGQHDLHERRPARGRRRVVGGAHLDAPGEPHRLAGRAVDPPVGASRRSPQFTLHRVRPTVSEHLGRLGGPGGRRHRRHHLRRPPSQQRALGGRGARLGSRCLHGRHDRFRADGGRRGHRGRASPRPVRDAALHGLQHGGLLRPLARLRRPTAHLGPLEDVAHVDVVPELHALDHPPGAHVQAGDDPDGNAAHEGSPFSVRPSMSSGTRPSSSARPTMHPATPVSAAASRWAGSPTPPEAWISSPG